MITTRPFHLIDETREAEALSTHSDVLSLGDMAHITKRDSGYVLQQSHFFPKPLSIPGPDGEPRWSAETHRRWKSTNYAPPRENSHCTRFSLKAGGRLDFHWELAGETAVRKLVDRGAMATSKQIVPVVLASDQPVPVYDSATGGLVNEVLVMSGLRIHAGRKQVPLLDSHQLGSVEFLRGSIRNLSVSLDELLIGEAHFSSADDSEHLLNLIHGGHGLAASAGFKPVRVTRIPSGKTEMVGKRLVQGPARVVHEWELLEGSAVCIGLDPAARFIL